MAKDGTLRGGARMGAGRKSGLHAVTDGAKAPHLQGRTAAEIQQATESWLSGCRAIPPTAIEGYAAVSARVLELDAELMAGGLLGEHPTTGAEVISPKARLFVDLAKLQLAQWQAIASARRAADDGIGGQSDDDEMEKILRRVR